MSQALGLAPADSEEAKHVAETLLMFFMQPEKLSLTMQPSSALSLKELVLMANKGTLYKDSKMTLLNN